MKPRIITFIVLSVVAVHGLFLLYKYRSPTPENAATPSASDTDPASPTQSIPAEPAKPYVMNRSNSGLSKDSKEFEASIDDDNSSPSEPHEELSEGTLTVGLHRGVSKLPPELAEIAQKGAMAVANLKWDEARDLYLELVRKAPDNALAYANLGVAEFQLGDLVAASGNLKQSLEINSSIAQNWQTLGLIQYQASDITLAISSLARSIHEGPRDARSRVYLAAVIRDYGWKEAALIELKRAVEIDPDLAEAHYNLAVTYLDLSPPIVELAKRHYYAAVDLGAEPSPELEKAIQSLK
tara:strand:- start:2108 stop:2995 length:888 start_codon:yes stop_codon:yes gene_type:complete